MIQEVRNFVAFPLFFFLFFRLHHVLCQDLLNRWFKDRRRGIKSRYYWLATAISGAVIFGFCDLVVFMARME